MGLLDRLRRASEQAVAPPRQATTVEAHLFGGEDDLEIVGEASYQRALWAICRSVEGERVRHQIVAVLVPEPDNPHDANAIAESLGIALEVCLRDMIALDGCH